MSDQADVHQADCPTGGCEFPAGHESEHPCGKRTGDQGSLAAASLMNGGTLVATVGVPPFPDMPSLIGALLRRSGGWLWRGHRVHGDRGAVPGGANGGCPMTNSRNALLRENELTLIQRAREAAKPKPMDGGNQHTQWALEAIAGQAVDKALRIVLKELRDRAELMDMGEYGPSQSEAPWDAYVIDTRTLDALLTELGVTGDE